MTNSNNYTYASGVVANQVNYNFPAISGSLGGVTLSGMIGASWEDDKVEEKVLEPVISATPDYGDEDCDHDFLVHDPDIHGHQYWCKICDKRFTRHPARAKEDLAKAAQSVVLAEDMKETMNSFREGAMTFTKAAEKTRFSVEEFSKAMKDLFPPEPITEELYSLGSKVPRIIEVGHEPQRTSCPSEIEALFGNPQVTSTDIQTIINSVDVFTDVVGINHHHDERNQKMIVTVDFIDGSKQRIEINDKDMALLGITNLRSPNPLLSSEVEAAMKSMREDMMRKTEYELAMKLYKTGAIRPKGVGFLDLGEPF